MAVGLYALTNLQNAKDALKVPDPTDDNLIERMIDAATGVIEAYCGRHFLSRVYTEWYDGDGEDELFLKEFPITAISRVATGVEDALYVWNAATDASRATVSISTTGVTLTVVGGLSAGTNTVLFAAATTVQAVVNAINALGFNWTATVIAPYATTPSTELRMLGARGCLGINATLEIADPILLEEYDTVWNEGLLINGAGWPCGSQNVRVDYTAGYVTVPDDIEEACLEIVGLFYNGAKRDPAMKSESLGDYSYTTGDTAVIEDLTPASNAILRRYKDRSVW